MQSQSRVLEAVLVSVLCAAVPTVALGQTDLSGGWLMGRDEDINERTGGPHVGEFVGLPINDAARARAEAWSATLWTVPEHQCIPHPADYGPNFSNLKIWHDVDPATGAIIAYHTRMAWMAPVRTIWMDGRPHPSEYAPHTWQGFSTGVWEGDMLTVTTTHLKPGYMRRNGVPRSEKATLLEHFIRDGDVLTWISKIDDPVYLTEPHIKSRNFTYAPEYVAEPYPCTVQIEIPGDQTAIPYYRWGENLYLNEFAAFYGIPEEAWLGGAQTMYPEYIDRLRTLPPADYTPPYSSAASE